MKDKIINKDANIISLFSTPVVLTNIGRSFTKDEMRCILNIPMEKINPLRQSKCFNIFDDVVGEGLKDIKKFCEHQLKNYMEEIEGVDTNKVNLQITQSWLNRIEPQGNQMLHNHKNSYLSGVLYIKCLPNDYINFEDQSFGLYKSLFFSRKKLTQWNSNTANVKIKEGDFIMFPSLISHQVGMNETKDKERISLALDTFPTHLPSLYPPFKI